MRVHQCREQIVRRGDGVKIAVEVKVDFRAGLDLRKAAASRAALHPKHGTERWLAGGDDDCFADVRQALRKADGRNRFALASRGGRSRRDDDQLAAPLERGIGQQFEADFAAFRANWLEILIGELEFARDFANREKSVGHNVAGYRALKNMSAGEKIITGSLQGSKPWFAALVRSLKAQLLDAPVEKFRDEKLVFAGTSDFVNPAKLAKWFARLAKDAKHFSIESELVNSPGKCVRGVENLIRPGGDANGPRSAGRHGPGRRGWFVADGGASIGGSGHIDRKLAKKFSGRIENLDAAVAAVGDIDVVVGVHGNAVRNVELAGLRAGPAPGRQPVAVLIDLSNTRIDVAVADECVPRRVPSHIGDLAKHAVNWW